MPRLDSSLHALDDLVMRKIIHKIVTRLGLEQGSQTKLRAFESLHSLDPDGAAVRKSSENVVCKFHRRSFYATIHGITRYT